jgi:hypothetical protein
MQHSRGTLHPDAKGLGYHLIIVRHWDGWELFIHLCVVLALTEECFHDNPSVVRDLLRGVCTL